jgi:hypothetical protein
MHLLLLILRLLLDWLPFRDRNGLQLAARADGRIEQVPAEQAVDGLWSARRRTTARRRAGPALALRAGEGARQPEATPPAAAPPDSPPAQ